MIDIQDMPSRAGDLYRRPDIVLDPGPWGHLNRMADARVHIAVTDAVAQSAHVIMDLQSSKRKPDAGGQGHNAPTPPKTGSMKQTNEPWKQPVEKEQEPGRVSSDDLERWQKTKTH